MEGINVIERCGICSALNATKLESHIISLAQLSLQRRSRRWISLKKLKNLKRRGVGDVLTKYLGKNVLGFIDINEVPFCIDCLLLISQIETFNSEYEVLMKKRKNLEKKFNLELLSGVKIATTSRSHTSSDLLRNNLIELLDLKEDFGDDFESDTTGSEAEEFQTDKELKRKKRKFCTSNRTDNHNSEILNANQVKLAHINSPDRLNEKEPRKKIPELNGRHVETAIPKIPNANDLIITNSSYIDLTEVDVKPERAFNFFNESFESEMGQDGETSNSYEGEFESTTISVDFDLYAQNCITDNGFKCYVCFNEYGNKVGLKRHFMVKHQLPAHECEFCSKRFSRRDVFQKHLKIHEKHQQQKDEVEKLKRGDVLNGQYL